MAKPALKYTTFESVKLRLVQKVQFQADPNTIEQGELPDQLLFQLILDAESDVEMDMRARYQTPFVSATKNTFDALPDQTKRMIRKAVDYRACILVMSTDFARGTPVEGENLRSPFEKLYADAVNKCLGRESIGRNDKIDRFKYSAPLDDLALSASNIAADDGVRGRIINTSGGRNAADYALNQVDDASRAAFGYGISRRRW